MGIDQDLQRRRKDQLARQRAVKGWEYRLGADDQAEISMIREFLSGGQCPGVYQRLYMLARQQLGLPVSSPHHGH